MLDSQLCLKGQLGPDMWHTGDHLSLRCDGQAEIKLIMTPQGLSDQDQSLCTPTTCQYHAPLPGWVWLQKASLKQNYEQAPEHVLEVTLWRNDCLTDYSLHIPMTQIRLRIEMIANHPELLVKAEWALLALEHLRHPPLVQRLSPHARRAMNDAAIYFNAPALLSATATEQDIASTITGGQKRRLGQGTPSSPLAQIFAQKNSDLDSLLPLALAPLSYREKVAAVADVTNTACTQGRFDALFRHANLAGLLPGLTTHAPLRHSGGLAPFLVYGAQLGQLSMLLDYLRPETYDHIANDALAHAIVQALHHPLPSSKIWQRSEVAVAWGRLMDSWAMRYWHGLQCAPLTTLAIALFTGPQTVDDPTDHALRDALLRHYGLVPTFLRGLATDTLSHHPSQDIARRAWDMIQSSLPAKMATGLDICVGLNMVDAHRFQMECLGPAGTVVTPESPPADQLAANGRLNAETAMRLLAHPLGVAEDAALAQLTRGGLQYTLTHARPHALRQARHQAAQQALNLVKTPDVTNANALEPVLKGLGIPAAGFLGTALALGLGARISGQIGAQMQHLGETMLKELPDTLQSNALRTPAVRSATALQQPHQGLWNTVVVVISCQANLHSRIETLRKGWLGELKDYDLPYLVMVGDGTGVQDKDVVHLNAPDDYEGLPQKMLAATDWIRRNTTFGHMIKIDDDSALDPNELILTQTYRGHDYYGRRLHRKPGQMTRQWHWAKSTSLRGQNEFDRSPEPSNYADGGSGYVLSRAALEALHQSAQSAEGQRLQHHSFFEDKMIGDLLALAGIPLHSDGYYSCVQRRPGGGEQGTVQGGAHFYPSLAAPTVQTHMDSAEKTNDLSKFRDTNTLWPKRIWPSHGPALTPARGGMLELLSPLERLNTVRAQPLVAAISVQEQGDSLPAYLDHCRSLGVTGFLAADFMSEDGSLDLLAQTPDVALFGAGLSLPKHKLDRAHVTTLHTLMSHLRIGQWTLLLQPGWELHKTGPTLPSLPKICATQTATCDAILTQHHAKDAQCSDEVSPIALRYRPWHRLAPPDVKTGPTAGMISGTALRVTSPLEAAKINARLQEMT